MPTSTLDPHAATRRAHTHTATNVIAGPWTGSEARPVQREHPATAAELEAIEFERLATATNEAADRLEEAGVERIVPSLRRNAGLLLRSAAGCRRRGGAA